ncbi:hypothetical protein M0Q50_04375 [bacterium]|jgi:hypothetical protein|nr:hypothetical protein [bacterium]
MVIITIFDKFEIKLNISICTFNKHVKEIQDIIGLYCFEFPTKYTVDRIEEHIGSLKLNEKDRLYKLNSLYDKE